MMIQFKYNAYTESSHLLVSNVLPGIHQSDQTLRTDPYFTTELDASLKHCINQNKPSESTPLIITSRKLAIKLYESWAGITVTDHETPIPYFITETLATNIQKTLKKWHEQNAESGILHVPRSKKWTFVKDQS